MHRAWIGRVGIGVRRRSRAPTSRAALAESPVQRLHLAIALAYLKATDLQVGMIVNFGSAIMRSRRVFRDLVMEKEGEKTGSNERQVLAASPRVADASNQNERDEQA
jgi:hypothetical protein